MAVPTGGEITEESVNTFSNKSISADTNLLSELEVDNLKSGVLDTLLASVPAAHDTVASAKAIKLKLDQKLEKTENLVDVPDKEAGRVNLNIYSRPEIEQLIQNANDQEDSFGDVVIAYNAVGDVETIETTMQSGHVRTETINYNLAGNVSSVNTIIPTLGINRTETINYDSSGNVIGISV